VRKNDQGTGEGTAKVRSTAELRSAGQPRRLSLQGSATKKAPIVPIVKSSGTQVLTNPRPDPAHRLAPMVKGREIISKGN
jgi:hypothetical protein